MRGLRGTESRTSVGEFGIQAELKRLCSIERWSSEWAWSRYHRRWLEDVVYAWTSFGILTTAGYAMQRTVLKRLERSLLGCVCIYCTVSVKKLKTNQSGLRLVINIQCSAERKA